jgi:hypothetical protein
VIHKLRWQQPGPRHRVLSRLWPLVEPVVQYRPRPYDAYLYYLGADEVRDQFQARTSFIVPCGDDVRAVEGRFDVVALEAPDNDRYLEDQTKAAVLPPPLDLPATTGEPVAGVPDDFLLTVFNPHHPRKGTADLFALATQNAAPIVWCRSTLAHWHDDIPESPALVIQENLSQRQLRYLYEHCRAFINFGYNPGFGWAVADALQYGVPVISRRLGVLTLPNIDLSEVYFFHDLDELAELMQRDTYSRVTRNLDDISPTRFVERFEALVEQNASHER